MGVELVEGSDLFVDTDDCVYMKTIRGPQESMSSIGESMIFFLILTFLTQTHAGRAGLMRAWLAEM